jgi:hypothetical protein
MQISLFCDYRGYANSKYESLFLALEESFGSVAKKRGPGRIGYGDLVYLKALVYKHAEEISSIPELLRNLQRSPVICEMIGLRYDSLPDLSRFYAFLAKTKNSEIQTIHHAAVKSLIGGGVVSTDVLIADSQPVMANTRHNNPKNPGRSLNKEDKIPRNPKATLGYYSYLKQPFSNGKQFSYFWGFRTHVLVSEEGIPLVEITKPNNLADNRIALMLLRKLVRVYGQKKGRIFIGDSAYDHRHLYNFIKDEIKGQACIPINPRNQQPDKLLGENGHPICQGGLEMKYCGITESEGRTRKKFRCPIIAGSRKEKAELPDECPCDHERFCAGKCYGCTAYIDVTDDARAQVPRQSAWYEQTYHKRTGVERYFSRLGRREAEQTRHFNYRSVRNQMSIAHLTLALTAVAAAFILEQPDKIRCFRSFADAA